MHEDVLRIQGVIIPDLRQELAQQNAREPHSIEVPQGIADAFERAFSTFSLEPGQTSPELKDLADVFVSFFRQSTIRFDQGLFARDRVPSDQQFINLLKCIWLMQRLRESTELQEAPADSHWPSYVTKLEDELSEECRRFERELLPPQDPVLTAEMVMIWPMKRESTALHEVQKEEMMEGVLDV